MAKKVFTITGTECFNANRNKNGSNITLAAQIEQTDKGPGARTAISINVPDQEAASNFTPGKKYTVTITEE